MEKVDLALNCLLPNRKYAIFLFIGGIYALSKISFQIGPNDDCVVSSMHALEKVSDLLSIDKQMLAVALTTRVISVPGENGEKIRYKNHNKCFADLSNSSIIFKFSLK